MKGLSMFDRTNSEHNYTRCLTAILVNQHRCFVHKHVDTISIFYCPTRMHIFVDLLPLKADIDLVGNAEIT